VGASVVECTEKVRRADVCARFGEAVRAGGFACAHVCASICVVACVHVGASICVVDYTHVCASAYLLGTCTHVGVHVPDVLPVALRHFDDFGTDFDELTATYRNTRATQ